MRSAHLFTAMVVFVAGVFGYAVLAPEWEQEPIGATGRHGLTGVIWTWTPNVVNHLPVAPLKPLYPGDAYVAWIGIDGYFAHRGEQTLDTLFGPTMKEVGRFIRKPFLIVETGAEPGKLRARAVRDLIGSVAAKPNVLGFVYFNHRGSGDWVLDQDPAALAVVRTHPQRSKFGFAAAAP